MIFCMFEMPSGRAPTGTMSPSLFQKLNEMLTISPASAEAQMPNANAAAAKIFPNMRNLHMVLRFWLLPGAVFIKISRKTDKVKRIPCGTAKTPGRCRTAKKAVRDRFFGGFFQAPPLY